MSTQPAGRSGRVGSRLAELPAVPVVRLLWRVSRPGTVGLGLVVLCRSLLGVGFIVAVGRLLGDTVQLGSGSAAADRAWRSFVLLAVIWLAQQVSASAQTLLAGWLSRRCGEYVTELVLDAALSPPGIGHLEDPLTADRLSLAQGVGGDAYPPQTAVSPLAGVVSTRLSAVSSAVLLAGVLWWAPVPVIAGWVVMGAHVGRQFRAQISGLEQRAGTMRRTGYLRRLGTGVDAAKEIRLLGIGGWVADRFSDSWRAGMSELFSRQPAAARAMAGRIGLLLGAHLLVLGWLAVAAAHGSISITALTIAVQAVVALAGFGWTGDPQWRLAGASASVRHVLALAVERLLAEQLPTGRSPAERLLAEPVRPPVRGIRFESVTFGYPGRAERPAAGLDLWIPAGRSLALVGENGAGKTTLVKLLAGLYQPNAGRITVDGRPLAELDPAGWRRQLSVVFQDFVRYELTARENVAFGRPDVEVDAGRLASALTKAGAADVLAGLPDGWDTMLSRQFGAADLSGGQWQRLALARALYAVEHGARVLVLDEPTAQLDARAEAALYARFLELTRGITTILISHRFNTVRLADRIAVLEAGRVAELGSHDELMALGGQYARMFRSQAERLGVA